MTPAELWKLFQPLVGSVEAAVRQLVARAPGWLPNLRGLSFRGLPAWTVALGVVAGGWAVAEALGGLFKLALRLAVLAFVAVLVFRVLV